MATAPGKSVVHLGAAAAGLITACLIAAALALALAPWPASAQPPAPQGQALHRALEGVWCNSEDGGATCWAYDEFFADGSFQACGVAEGDARPFAGSGDVSVSGRTMCYVVTTASDNFWLPPGSRYCTEIVAIDRHTHRYRDVDTGAEFTLHRRPRAEKRCPSPARR